MAGLLVAEQVAGAADLEVAHRDLEAGAELRVVRQRAEAPRRLLGQRGRARVEQVRVGALAAAADAAADLVELGEAEHVGALDDQRVRLRDVDARLDDARRDEHVGLAAQEAPASAPRARSRRAGRARPRSASPGHSPRRRSAISSIVSTRLWRKNAWPPRAFSRSSAWLDELLVVLADVGLDRPAALGRRLDHADVAHARRATSAACAGSASRSSRSRRRAA